MGRNIVSPLGASLRRGDLRAAPAELVHANLRLVILFAKPGHVNRGLPMLSMSVVPHDEKPRAEKMRPQRGDP